MWVTQEAPVSEAEPHRAAIGRFRMTQDEMQALRAWVQDKGEFPPFPPHGPEGHDSVPKRFYYYLVSLTQGPW